MYKEGIIDLSKLSEINFHEHFKNEVDCHQYLAAQRWQGYITCPYQTCDGDRVWVFKDGITYKCCKCKRKFKATKGTIFESSKMRLSEWYRVIMKLVEQPNGVASTTLAKALNFTQKTAWFMAIRLRYAMAHIDDGTLLSGIVQIDQAHFGGRNKNRHADKKIKYIQQYVDPDYKDKLTFHGMLEENGRIRAVEIPDEEALTLYDYTTANVDKDALLYTDNAQSYRAIDYYYERQFVNHKAKQYMDGNCTTNAIEGFWSYAKRHEKSHIWISKKYRNLYIQEAVARYNMRGFHFQVKFNLLLQATTGRLMFKDLSNQLRIAA